MFDRKSIESTIRILIARRNELAEQLEWIDSEAEAAPLQAEAHCALAALMAIREAYPEVITGVQAELNAIVPTIPFPARKPSYSHPFEEGVAASDDVLVKVNGFAGWKVGRYLHGIGEWQVDGLHGFDWIVSAWSPMPSHSGIKVLPKRTDALMLQDAE